MPSVYDMIGAMDDLMGDDEFVGAPRRVALARRPAASGVKPKALAALKSPLQGVPQAGPRMEPLGFGNVIFNATSGVLLSSTARPQKPFKGSRFVVVTARSGTTATGLVTLVNLIIGSRNVLVSAQPIPAEAFAPGAFAVELNLDEAGPGIDITAQFAISSAPTTTDTVVVGAAIIGLTWS